MLETKEISEFSTDTKVAEKGAQNVEAILDRVLEGRFSKGLSQFDILAVTMQWLSVQLLRIRLEERIALKS
jgi:hypothetical protein